MSEHPRHEPPIHAPQRLSLQSTLFEALSCLLTQGLSCVPVGDGEPARSFLSTRTLLQAWHDGLPGETPISRLPLDTAASLPDEAIGADTLIDDAGAARLQASLPAWFKAQPARSFVLLPLLQKGQPVGLIYIARRQTAIALDEAELSLLRSLRNQAVLAFRATGASGPA